MFKKIPYFSVILASCTTPQTPIAKSAWANLKDKTPAICKGWELDEKDYEVRSLTPVTGSNQLNGFIAETKSRNGSIGHAYLKTNDPLQLNFAEMKPLPLSTHQKVHLGTIMNKIPILISSINQKGRSSLEARNLNDSQIIAKSNFVLDGEITDAEASILGDSIWLTLRSGDYTSYFAKFVFNGKSGSFSKVNIQSESRGALILAQSNGKDAVIFESANQGGKTAFRLGNVKSKELIKGEISEYVLSEQDSLESWASIASSDGIDMAAIVGDSMVGQGKLVISRLENLNTGVKQIWKKEIPLSDIHLSEPIWSTGNNNTLILMKWLEGEGTLGVYNVSKNGIESDKDRNFFPAGSVVLTSFRINTSELGAIIRNKKDELWIHKVCKIAI